MSRNKTEAALSSASNADDLPALKRKRSEIPGSSELGAWVARVVFVVSAVALASAWQPFGLNRWIAAVAGFAAALVLVLAELGIRRVDTSGLAGGAAGLVLGIFAALLVCLVISRTAETEPTRSFLEYGTLLGFGYLGLFWGAHTGRELRLRNFLEIRPIHGRKLDAKGDAKLLDTSVLIDGRIADICEAQFLDGPLEVPQFVLHELQQIADSSDTLRRQRGRRGLEVLQRIQKMQHIEVAIVETPDPPDGDVDRRLVEL